MIRGLYLNGMTDDWSVCMDIRKKVYAEDYNITVETDNEDAMALQVILYDANEAPIGSARLIFDMDGIFKFDYLAVLPEARKNGYADFIMHMIFDKARLCGATHLESKEMGHCTDYFKRYGFKFEEERIILDLKEYFDKHKCSH